MIWYIFFAILLLLCFAVVGYYRFKPSPMCGNCVATKLVFGGEEDDIIVPEIDDKNLLRKELRVSRPTYYYAYHASYNQVPFRFKGWSVKRTNQAIHQAFKELGQVSGVDFRPWTGTGPAHIIVEFRHVVGATNNAGQFEAPRTIVVSSGRDFKLNAATWRYRIAHNIIQHETFHLLGMRAVPPADSFWHSKDKTCVYNQNGTARYFCPQEVRWMQSRYKQPYNSFKPMDLKLQQDVVKPMRKKLDELWSVATKAVNDRKAAIRKQKEYAAKRDSAIKQRNASEPGPNKIKWRDEARKWHDLVMDHQSVIRDLTKDINDARKAAFAQHKKNEPQEKKLYDLVQRWKNVPKANLKM